MLGRSLNAKQGADVGYAVKSIDGRLRLLSPGGQVVLGAKIIVTRPSTRRARQSLATARVVLPSGATLTQVPVED